MKYDLYFNHLRNIGYVFKFNRDLLKIYDLYFKYIPVYEIFVHVLKDVEINRQVDKIKPASFLHSFINALGIKNKNIDDILKEILKEHTSIYTLIEILNSENQEIINISKQFLKDIELLKKSGGVVVDDLISNNCHEINKKKQLMHPNESQNFDISLINIPKLEDNKNTGIINFNKSQHIIDYLFNEISTIWGLKTLENSQNDEIKYDSIKNADLINKGRILEDKQIDTIEEITINKQPIIEAERYRDSIIYTHFFTKILESYYREIKFGFKYGLESYGNELDNLYKNYLYDTVYDLLFFITHRDMEYEKSMVKKIQLHTYSTFGTNIVVVGVISTELELIEVNQGQYYQVDYYKKGKIINDHQLILSREINKETLQECISLEEETYIYTIKTANIPNENIFNNSIKQSEIGNENVSNIKLKQITGQTFDVNIDSIKNINIVDSETTIQYSIIINTLNLDTYYTNILNWIDFGNEIYYYGHKIVDPQIKRGVVINDNQVDIRCEFNTYTSSTTESSGLNIKIQNPKDIISSGSNVIFNYIKNIYISAQEVSNSELSTIFVEKIGKSFDDYKEFSISENLIEINICDLILADQPNLDIIITLLQDTTIYNNDIIIYKITNVETSTKLFNDYIDNNLHLPFVEIIINQSSDVDKTNKLLDYYSVDNITAINLEVIITELNFGDSIQKLMNDYCNLFIATDDDEINKYCSNYTNKNNQQFDNYNNENVFANDIEILLDNIITFGDINEKNFDDWDNKYFNAANNKDVLIIDYQLTEKKNNQFNEYLDEYYNSKNIEVYVDNSNVLIEEINKQFDNYNFEVCSTTKQEYSKDSLINIEIESNILDDYDNMNKISINNFDIYISIENTLIEKIEKNFLIVDVNNQNIINFNIDKHIFLIIETKNKEFITNLDEKTLNSTTKDIIEHIPNFIEIKSKNFHNHQEENLNADETVVYQNQVNFIEKLNNQLDGYNLEWHIISPTILQKNGSKHMEKNNNRFDNYDILSTNSGYSEVIIERFPYLTESISKIFDVYVEDDINTDELETKIIQQTILIKQNKELDYNEIENIILGHSDILFPGTQIIEKIQRTFDNHEEKYSDPFTIDTVIVTNEYVEKSSNQFNNFNTNNLLITSDDIDNFIPLFMEKDNKKLGTFDVNNLLITSDDIDNFTPLFMEKNNKKLGDSSIVNLSFNFEEINNWMPHYLTKINKTFDNYNFTNLHSLGLEVKQIGWEIVDKINRMFEDYNINGTNEKNITIDSQKYILVEQTNRTLDLFEEDYQSKLKHEIMIESYKMVDNSTKVLDNIDFNFIDDKYTESITIYAVSVEKHAKEFYNYSDEHAPITYVDIKLYETNELEKSKKEFNNFIDKITGLTAIDIDKSLSEVLEKLRKEFNDYSSKYFSNSEIQISKLNSDDTEKATKEFYDFLNLQQNSGGYNIVINDQNGLEKRRKEFEIYNPKQNNSGNIDVYDHGMTSSGTTGLIKKEKELEEFNDKHLHKNIIEIIYNIADGETNLHRTFDEVLIEIIGTNNINSNLSVEEIFMTIVTNSHKKFFDMTFSDVLTKACYNYVELLIDEISNNKYIEKEMSQNNVRKNRYIGIETFKDQAYKGRYKEVELPRHETSRHRDKRLELVIQEVTNWLINTKKMVNIKSVEGKSQNLKWIDYLQQSILFPKNSVTKKSFETWKNFKDAIIGNRQIIIEKHYNTAEEKFYEEIYDAVNKVLNWINLVKKEVVIHTLTNYIEEDVFSDAIEDIDNINFVSAGKQEINHYKFQNQNYEQDIFSDEIEEINFDFTNIAKSQEIITHRNKNFEDNDINDEIDEFDQSDFITCNKMEINLHNIKSLVDDVLLDEIDEIDAITHITHEKINALIHTQKLIDKMRIDTRPYNSNIVENKKSLEADIKCAKSLEANYLNEILYKHTDGVETGKRGFNPKLQDWWSQDWVFLTERQTPKGEMITMREEAIRDFKNFMDRCIAYKDPIKGEEIDELVYKWSVNTDYNTNYVNEIEHFYYLIHTKLGKNNYYTKGQLELITSIIIEKYKKFYVDEFKKYHFELVDSNEEVRIRLRAMLHFYMFLEQLIDANQGYLKTSTVQEGIDLIKKILREWIESETSYFEPTEEELVHLDPWMVNRLRENLPQDYNYMVRWFEWYCKEEEFIYGHNFEKDGFTAVSNIRDKMISYFNTHWGVRRTSYMDELDKSQIEIENARKLLDNGVDPQGRQLAMAMMKAVNLIKPSVFIDTSIVDKIRGMMHGKVNRTNKKFNINGLGTIQRSSLMGWKGMNKHDKNQTNTWTSQNNERYANLKDSYNIDQHSLIVNPDYNKMIYNIVKIEKIEE